MDLNAWKEGHKLVLYIYKVTGRFPQNEQFGLINQMRRASVSITSNIAEGFSRNTSRDKIQFYCVAQGSLTELQNQLVIAEDIGYIAHDSFQKLFDQSITVHKIINGLIKSLKSRYYA